MKFESYKLSELVQIIGGGTPKRKVESYWNGDIPWLSVKDFNDKKRWVHQTDETITEKGLNESSTKLLKTGDLIISARGTVGEIAQLAKPMAFNQSCYGLRAHELLTTNDYLYYWIRYNVNYVKNNTHGSVFDTITRNTFDNLIVKLPPKEYQNKVVKVLTMIDKKIELNNTIISNLEELAQTLFKHWFVDFEFPNEEGKPYKSSGGKMVESELGMIPKGWNVTKIQSMPIVISDHVANGSFASIKKNVQIVEEKDYALFLRNTDLKKDLQGERRYVTKKSYEFLKKTQLFGGEVIISNVGDVGTIHRCPPLNRPMVLGNNLIVIQPTEQKETLNTYFYFLFKSFEGKKLIESITSGSVQMKFNKTDFRNLKIVIPENFEKMNILNEILLKLDLLKREIEVLSKVRDNLLPKLLSGEIELPDDMEVTDDVPIS